MRNLYIIILFFIFFNSSNAQQYVVVSVTSFTNIILQPLGGGPTIRTGCVEHSDIVPYVGQIYTDMGGDCYEAPEPAYQNVCFIPGCEINFDNVIEQPTCGQNNGYISVTVVQGGTYEYNFNNQGWSSNNIWTNLPTGEYTILARNVDGSCEGFQSVLLYNETAGLMMSALPSTCNPVTNTYDVSVVIAGTGFPYGTLTVNLGSQSKTISAPFPNPTTVSFTGIQANGPNSIPVTAIFSYFPSGCTLNTTYNEPANCGQVNACSSTVSATPGSCNPTNNQYTLTGQVTLNNPPNSGTVTVQIVGGGSQTFTLPQITPISYSIAGQIADGASHTVDVTISGISCASSITYTAPINCNPFACSSSVNATPGTCNLANNQYSVTGQITLTNPPSTGTVTVQIVGGGSQTFTLPQISPISYSIASQIADGASHTVDVSISGVSCTSSINYIAPVSCIGSCLPDSIKICSGQSAELTGLDGLTNYKWYIINAPGDTVQVATGQIFTTSTVGNYIYKANDSSGCPASMCCPITLADSTCCVINNLNLVIGNCNNKGTLTNAADDDYTFTLNPSGNGIGTTYIVNGLPNSPQTGTYGNPTTFGPYLISAGVLNITVVDNVASTCTKTASVTPPPSCSVCNVTPPVLTVNDNVCPSRTGTINLIQGCGAGTFIQYSINNGTTWSSVKPLYSTTPRKILARCVNSIDTLCKSTNTSVTTDPKKCTFSGNECTLIANATIDPCKDNGTNNISTDDYFTIQVSATVENGGSSNKYEVVIGADPLTGSGGNVLNSSGTAYGSPVTVGNTKIFMANGTSSYQLIIRDINNNNCFQSINISPLAPCSIAPPKSPCYPVPCVPIQLIKN